MRALVVVLALTLSVVAACSESAPEVDQDAVVAEDLVALRTALERYEADHGELPATLDVLVRPDAAGRHYLTSGTPALHDPWGRRYVYAPGADGSFDVRSLGPR